MSEAPWILGLGGGVQDFSAALAQGSDIAVAVETERVTRRKYGAEPWYSDPVKPAIDYCLEAASVGAADVDRVVSSDLLPLTLQKRWDARCYPHHLCHAAAAVMLLPPLASACVLVYDGSGGPATSPDSEDAPGDALHVETVSFFEYREGALTLLGRTLGRRVSEWQSVFDGQTNSVGCMFELANVMLGFARPDSGKTMGLAAWGRPRFVDELGAFAEIGTTMEAAFAFDPFSPELGEVLQRALDSGHDRFQVRADLAASFQALLTEFLRRAYGLVADRDFEYFCLAGGCALNSVANGMLAKELRDGHQILVPPHAGDGGIALGSIWLDRGDQGEDGAWTVRGRPIMSAVARPGREYPGDRVARAAANALDHAAEDCSVTGPEGLAALLAEGKIIGVFHGASEIGPRALGGRSILADPRRSEVKERLNREIKLREAFRPLAPIVLASEYETYFAPPSASNPFMVVVADALEPCVSSAPAVLHVDRTARVQTVDPAAEPFLAAILTSFQHQTGVPVLLNTSFNRRNEPIVETPEHAIAAFLALGLDALWLQDRLIVPVQTPTTWP